MSAIWSAILSGMIDRGAATDETLAGARTRGLLTAAEYDALAERLAAVPAPPSSDD